MGQLWACAGLSSLLTGGVLLAWPGSAAGPLKLVAAAALGTVLSAGGLALLAALQRKQAALPSPAAAASRPPGQALQSPPPTAARTGPLPPPVPIKEPVLPSPAAAHTETRSLAQQDTLAYPWPMPPLPQPASSLDIEIPLTVVPGAAAAAAKARSAEALPFDLVAWAEQALVRIAAPAQTRGLLPVCIVDPALPAWRLGQAQPLRMQIDGLLVEALAQLVKGSAVLPSELVLRVLPGATPQELLLSAGPLQRSLTLPLAPQAPAALQPLKQQAVIFFEPHEPSAEALAAQLSRLGATPYRWRQPQELQNWITRHTGDAERPWVLVAAEAEGVQQMLEASMAWLDPERVVSISGVPGGEADDARAQLKLPGSLSRPLLSATLAQRLAPAAAAVRDSGTVLPAAAAPAHVLVVEDDRLNQTIVCSMLHNAGYHTTAADNGGQALALLAEQDFDLVLMDWQLPDMDGLEVTRRLRAREAGGSGKQVPVVALTANVYAEDRAACLAAGMNDFLSKPVLAVRLLEAAARWTEGPSSRRTLASAASQPQPH